MEKRMHDKYFTEEQLKDMKASTYSQLRKQEETVVETLSLFFIVGFVELIVGIAMLFWFNKFIIFLAVVGFLFLLVAFLFYMVSWNLYSKIVTQAGGNINIKNKKGV